MSLPLPIEKNIFSVTGSGNLEAFKSTFKEEDLNLVSKNTEQTLLHLACKKGYSELVKEILSYKNQEILFKCDKSKRYPLHLAVYSKNIDCIKLVLSEMEKYNNLKLESPDVKEPLAVNILKSGSVDVFNLLKDKVSFRAAQNRNIDLIEVLLNNYKETQSEENIKLAYLLLETDFDIDFTRLGKLEKKESVPQIVRFKDIGLIEKYLKRAKLVDSNNFYNAVISSSIYATDESEGLLWLDSVIAKCKPYVPFTDTKNQFPYVSKGVLRSPGNILVSAMSLPYEERLISGQLVGFFTDPPSNLEIENFAEKILDRLKIFHAHGFDLGYKNLKGQNLLHISTLSRFNNIETVNYLIKNGVDVNERDKNGYTPLMFGIDRYSRGLKDNINYLVKVSAPMGDCDSTKESVLSVVIDNYHYEIFETIVDSSDNFDIMQLVKGIALKEYILNKRNSTDIKKNLIHILKGENVLDKFLSKIDQKELSSMLIKGNKNMVKKL